MKKIFALLICLCSLGVGAYPAAGFQITGSLKGTVSDSSGALVPGTDITLTMDETGQVRREATNERGHYNFTGLPIGSYTVQADRDGFLPSVRNGVFISIGQAVALDLVLKVAGSSETVTVSGTPSIVESMSSQVGGLVRKQQIEDLPLNGRDLTQLVAFQAGVATPPVSRSTTKLSISGGRPYQTSFLLDGTDISRWDGKPGGVTGLMLGVESVDEFVVLSNMFTSEYGGTGASVISSVTRSGTNSFHGSSYYYTRNSALDARNYFDDPNEPIPSFHRHQFGGSFGGPVIKNRLFFFGNYEGLRQSLGVTNTLRVPSAEARQGMLVDPESEDGFRHVEVNPGTAIWLTAFPEINSARMFGPDIGEAIVPTVEPTRGDFVSIKMDYRFPGGDVFSARYTIDDSFMRSPSPTNIPGLGIADNARNQYATLEYAGALDPRILNVLRFGFSRNHDGSAWELDALPNEFSLVPGKPLGRIRVGGLSSVGVDTYRPNLWISNVFDVNDTISWSMGEHTVKFGGQFKRTQVQTVADLRYSGEVAFSSLEKFLEGAPTRFAGALPGSSSYRGFRRWYGAFFIHDDWRVNERLTLNLGLRWEAMPAVSEVNGRVATLESVYTSTEFTVGNPWFVAHNTLKGFAPRFGFAFDPTGSGRSVLRGGFGVYAEPIRENNFANARSTPPFVTDVVVSRPPWPFPLEGDVTIPPLSPTVMERNPKIPVTYQWNLLLQRQVFSDLVVTAGYMGSRSLHLGSVRCPNCAAGRIVDGWYYWEEGLPRPNPAFEYIRYLTMDASANYNAFQLRVEKRYSSGFAVQGSFTFSKAMDNGSGQSGSELGGVGNIFTRQNEQNVAAEWALSSFDIRRNLNVNLSYALPFGPGKRFSLLPGGWIEKFAGGWKFNTILSLMDGSPATVHLDFNRSNSLHNRDIADRPDLKAGASNNPVLGGPDRYYDPTAFVLQPAGFAGTLGRNTLILPGYVGLDASMSKRFTLKNDSNIEFRGEFFNVLNHPNFAAPDLVPVLEDGSFNPTAGSIGSTRGTSRQIQFALRYAF
ncbi:MAG: TonB-dependent receptor [Acidobacteriota bacterium]